MLKLDNFILTRKYNFMLTDYSSTANRAYTYLVVSSLLSYLAAVKLVCEFVVIRTIY